MCCGSDNVSGATQSVKNTSPAVQTNRTHCAVGCQKWKSQTRSRWCKHFSIPSHRVTRVTRVTLKPSHHPSHRVTQGYPGNPTLKRPPSHRCGLPSHRVTRVTLKHFWLKRLPSHRLASGDPGDPGDPAGPALPRIG